MIERGQQQDLFVGQIRPDPKHQDQLVANLYRRKPKGPSSLGRLCPLSEFSGFKAFVSQENLSRLARECGWKEYAAEEVFRQHAVIRNDKANDDLSVDADSLFLKLVGRGVASTQLDELKAGKSARVNEVLHLKVDPDIADPAYLTHWFNETRIGLLSLDALKGGTIIPRIRAADLLRSSIYLPSLVQQRLVIEGAAYLGRIRAEANELESALWSETESVDGLVERIHSINHEDRYEDWIETLPFPRRRFSGDTSLPRARIAIATKCCCTSFEATAAFLATVHLSAFMSDDETWEEYGKNLHEKLSEQRLSLNRATFGTWKLVAERLGSVCSSIIKDAEMESLWQRIYGTTDLKVVEMLSDPRLRQILQKANKV